MEACTETECSVRLLGLGNELLADDAFGILVAREVERRLARIPQTPRAAAVAQAPVPAASRLISTPAGGEDAGSKASVGMSADAAGTSACATAARPSACEECGSDPAMPPAVDVVCSSASGFHLLDQVLGARRLVVVDTLATRAGVPGTIHVFRAGSQAGEAGGAAPHFVGLFDVLSVAASLGLPVPEEVTIIGVEAADCVTVGGEMHPDVRAAVGKAVVIAEDLLAPP